MKNDVAAWGYTIIAVTYALAYTNAAGESVSSHFHCELLDKAVVKARAAPPPRRPYCIMERIFSNMLWLHRQSPCIFENISSNI